MHPCLEIYELLEQIVSHVEGKDSLATLARVCRLFEEPALDALYANVDCFFEFFVSLSSDVCFLTDFANFFQSEVAERGLVRPELGQGFSRKRLTFKREISSSEWSALITRAARVKAVHQTIYRRSSSKILPSRDVITALNKCPVPILFPNLRTLDFMLPFGSLNPHLLLGPQLRHLSIADDAVTLCTQVPTLSTRCPLIETFTTTSTFLGVPLDNISAVSDVVVHWKHLRSLSIGPITDSILTHIASLRSFHRLLLEPTVLSPWLRTTQTFHIPNIDCLTISGDKLQTCADTLAKLFSCAPSDQVSAANVSALDVRGKPPSLSAIHTAIITYISPEHLVELSIRMFGSSEAGSSTGFDISDFSCFPRLRKFIYFYRFSGRDDCIVTGAQALALMSHWPLLEEFQVWPTIEPPLTLLDLMTIFRQCPHLYDFDTTISVSSEDVTTLLACPELREQNSRISTIRFKTAAETTLEVETIVSVLQETIPQLSAISSPGASTSTEEQFFWDSVCSGLKTKSQATDQSP